MLEKLRAGSALSAREQVTHEQGLVSVLRQLHDELDAATLARSFKGAKAGRGEDFLETLASLGQARALPDGRIVAA